MKWAQKRGVKIFQGALTKKVLGGKLGETPFFLFSFFFLKPVLPNAPFIPESRVEKGSPAEGKKKLPGKQWLIQGSPGTHTNSSAPCLGRNVKPIQS